MGRVVARGWQLYHVFSSNAAEEHRLGAHLRNSVLLVGVAATSMAVFASELSGQSNDLNLHDLAPGPMKQYGTVLTCMPILVGILVAIDNRLRSFTKWRVLTVAAETIKSEIYAWRTNCGDYSSASHSECNKLLSARVQSASEEVFSTIVIEGSLSEAAMHAARAENYVVTRRGKDILDDGCSTLTPDDYLQQRMLPLVKYYKERAKEAQNALARFQVCIYMMGALGTLLAAFNLDILVAITTAVSSALQNLIETEAYGEGLHVYNRAHTDLTNVMNWWNSLSAVEQANPQRYATLVTTVETVKLDENNYMKPGTSSKEQTDTLQLGQSLELDQFKQDINDNISAGKIHFMCGQIRFEHPPSPAPRCGLRPRRRRPHPLAMPLRQEHVDGEAPNLLRGVRGVAHEAGHLRAHHRGRPGGCCVALGPARQQARLGGCDARQSTSSADN